MTEAEAYTAGWNACMAGCDGRYSFTPDQLRASLTTPVLED